MFFVKSLFCIYSFSGNLFFMYNKKDASQKGSISKSLRFHYLAASSM